MKKYFIISDVHSYYSYMIEALNKNNFDINNPEHIIISCGDNFDRGNESKEMLNFLYNLYIQNRLILIKGNHEDLFKEMIIRGEALHHDFSNGTVKTLGQLQIPNSFNEYDVFYNFDELTMNYDKRFDEIIQNSLDYYETQKYIFVHGWIPVNEKMSGYTFNSNWRNANKKEWNKARWYCGIEMAENGIIEPNKTIICGHWHAAYGNIKKEHPECLTRHDTDKFLYDPKFHIPYYSNGIIAIDACTALTHFCNCLVFNEDEL